MRYTPLATDAHGGRQPTEAARAPHVTEKGYILLLFLTNKREVPHSNGSPLSAGMKAYRTSGFDAHLFALRSLQIGKTFDIIFTINSN